MAQRNSKVTEKRSFFLRVVGPIFCTVFAVYLSNQLFRFANLPPLILLAAVAWVFFVVFWILFVVLYFWLNPNYHESKIAVKLQQAGNFAQGYFSYLFTFVFFRDVASFFAYLIGREIFIYNQAEAFFILAAPPILMFLGRLMVFLGPFNRRIKIRKPHLKKDLQGLRIVQLSDIHIGPGVSRAKINSIIKQTNRLEPDIIALTGDIVDHLDHWFSEEINDLRKLKAKYGVFYVPGNHEYYWGFHPIIEKIRNLGISVLLNSNEKIQIGSASFAVCGVTDLAAKYFSLEGPSFEKAIHGVENCDFKLVLSHHPKTADEARHYKFDLQLSGHTHGGQFIPWSLMIRLFQKYTMGLYQLGSMKLYVNRGTGYWGPPDRLGTFSEITSLTLVD